MIHLNVPSVQLNVKNNRIHNFNNDECLLDLTSSDLSAIEEKDFGDITSASNSYDNNSSLLDQPSNISFNEKEYLHKSQNRYDDIPVPSPKKDFQTLLEERLKDAELINIESDAPKSNVKKPFLRKGQGLLRYQPQSETFKKISKRCSLPSKNAGTNTKRAINQQSFPPKRCSPQQPLPLFKSKTSLPLNSNKTKFKKTSENYKQTSLSLPQKLSLKNVAPPAKLQNTAINSLPKVSIEKTVNQHDNSSDCEVKNRKEQEETKIFEFLEEKAENSSFCSTSSTVLAFLQQSSPLKKKIILHNASKKPEQGIIKNSEDHRLEEIVRTTQTNSLPLKQSHINEEVSEKAAHWDSLLDTPVPDQETDDHGNNIILPYGMDVDMMAVSKNQKLNDDDENESLHVRFSDHNDYKTLSDTSSVFSDTPAVTNYVNRNEAWSDCSVTTDSSDMESITSIDLKNLNDSEIKQAVGQLSKLLNKALQKRSNVDEESDVNKSDDEDQEQDKQSVNYQTDNNGDDENDDNSDDNESKDRTLQEINFVSNEDNAKIKEEDTLYKSELLKSRLLELEKEIEIFRQEATGLKLQRQKLQDEQIKLQEERLALQRSFKQKEVEFEEEKTKAESILREEKKRLIREKVALEQRLKEAYEKSQKSKQERQEIQSLKEQLLDLKDELVQKESKWSAAQARQKSQIRVLQTENTKLKQEIEKLQQRRIVKHQKKVPSNTRAIHQINKALDEKTKLSSVKPTELLNEKKDDNKSFWDDNNSDDAAEVKENQCRRKKVIKSPQSIARTRNLYEALIKEATSGVNDVEEEVEKQISSHMNNETDGQNFDSDSSDNDKENKSSNSSLKPRESCSFNRDLSHNIDQSQHDDVKLSKNVTSSSTKQGIREVKHPDGRVEYWYPNGNVKKILPDKNMTKIIYYNGDVQETDKDGTVRYFYSKSRTWHTSTIDGLEILEFPDGQVERRSKDGTVEILFPDGSIRTLQSDGSEKWALPDGTVSETSSDGNKIITLPNGQREVHTKEHKRREYPDGTVKLVYPDGIQETRYANGRVRLKDKDGNLVMDSHNYNN